MAMSNAERQARYRARQTGKDVPPVKPGPEPGHGGRPRIYRQWRIVPEAMHYLNEAESIDDILENPEDKGEREALENMLAFIAMTCDRLISEEAFARVEAQLEKYLPNELK